MKMSKVAKMVGVDRRTIFNWIEHPKLRHLFSKDATNKGDRELNERDIFVINTIAYLRDHQITEWSDIAEKIEEGYVATGFSLAAVEVDTGRTPIQQYTYAAEAKIQLEVANKRITQLEVLILEIRESHEQQMEAQRRASAEDKERLLREMGEREGKLLRELGQYETMIKVLQKQLEESQRES